MAPIQYLHSHFIGQKLVTWPHLVAKDTGRCITVVCTKWPQIKLKFWFLKKGKNGYPLAIGILGHKHSVMGSKTHIWEAREGFQEDMISALVLVHSENYMYTCLSSPQDREPWEQALYPLHIYNLSEGSFLQNRASIYFWWTEMKVMKFSKRKRRRYVSFAKTLTVFYLQGKKMPQVSYHKGSLQK